MTATGNVNVRSGASSNGTTILGTLAVGETVAVTGNTDGNWVEVTYNGQTGYVYNTYLASSGSGSTTTGTGSNGTSANTGNSSSGSTGSSSGVNIITPTWTVSSQSGTMYAAANANVRSGAGSSYSVITTLYVGEAVAITGTTDNGWIQISYGGQTGYVANNLLSWNDPSSSSGNGNGSGSSSTAWDDSYYMYDSDSRLLTESELSGWSAGDLAVLRNEIFARHGRIFTTQKWNDYFSQKTWYVPRSYDVNDQLNDIEWANVELIMKLEEQL